MAVAFNPKGYVPGKARSRSKSKRNFNIWLGGLLGVLFVAGLLNGFYFDWRYRSSLKELSKLRTENADISRRIKALEKDPQLYEEIARKKYGYVKKGERLIIFGKRR